MESIGPAAFPPSSLLCPAVMNPAARHCSKTSHGFTHLVLRQPQKRGRLVPLLWRGRSSQTWPQTVCSTRLCYVWPPPFCRDKCLHCGALCRGVVSPGKWSLWWCIPHQEGRIRDELNKHPPNGVAPNTSRHTSPSPADSMVITQGRP